MKTMFKKRWYLFIPLILAGFVAFGFFTMYLWNWLMPAIFHLPELTFWQTLGLMLLSRLVLGGFGGHAKHGRYHCRRNMHKKWEHMTPEEREQFREHIHMHQAPWAHRCDEENK
jgi:hypothetical protein